MLQFLLPSLISPEKDIFNFNEGFTFTNKG